MITGLKSEHEEKTNACSDQSLGPSDHALRARYPTCCPLVRFPHMLPKGASKMLRATGHARMVTCASRRTATRGAARKAKVRLSDQVYRAARLLSTFPSEAWGPQARSDRTDQV